jgi:hypothetical protein
MSTAQLVRRFALAYALLLMATVGGLAALGTSPSSLNMLLAFAAAVAWSVHPVRRETAPRIPAAHITPVVVALSSLGAVAMGAYVGYVLGSSARDELWRSVPFAYLASVALQGLVAYVLVKRSAARRSPPASGG